MTQSTLPQLKTGMVGIKIVLLWRLFPPLSLLPLSLTCTLIFLPSWSSAVCSFRWPQLDDSFSSHVHFSRTITLMARTRKQLGSIRDVSLGLISLRETWGRFTDLATKYLLPGGRRGTEVHRKGLCLIGWVIWKCWCQLVGCSSVIHSLWYQPDLDAPAFLNQLNRRHGWFAYIVMFESGDTVRKAVMSASISCWRSSTRAVS